ncbi:2OG-Fe(II) oxygenase [uncultured Aquimarina sp.]|uniref:2OG-Fe(II) oxygenase n=1 Tax=uncultured Aquimarina sp. TaxID=575652 RepID=UPI00260ED677|nr:2OG-Fe(II) oxygenase [uncultured Aquimarina sp.]
MYISTTINDLLVLEIDHFLTKKEVQKVLEPRIENFEAAIGHYPAYYRNNDRLVEDNGLLSSKLFSKLKKVKALKKEIKDKIVGINERIRFCKYQKGQLFSKHQDGIYYPNAISESRFTFLLYLNGNESFDGGNTEFYSSKKDENPIKTIIPKKGKLVIFDHKLWHKGTLVTNGNKYILRTDVIIKRISDNTHHDGYIWNLLELNQENILSCGRDTKIKLWNTDLELKNSLSVNSKSVLKMVRFNESEFISCSRDFTVKRWNLSGEVLSAITFDEMILNIRVNKNKEVFAVGTSGKLYKLNFDLRILKTIKIHNGWIWDLSIINDETIITCSEDCTVHITNIQLGITECLYTNDHSLFCLSELKKNIIYIGSKDGKLLRFSIDTGHVHKIKVHNDIIRSIVFYKESIITCGEDNMVLSIDQESYEIKEIFKSNNFMQDIIVLKDKIYGAGYDGIITKIAI